MTGSEPFYYTDYVVAMDVCCMEYGACFRSSAPPQSVPREVDISRFRAALCLAPLLLRFELAVLTTLQLPELVELPSAGSPAGRDRPEWTKSTKEHFRCSHFRYVPSAVVRPHPGRCRDVCPGAQEPWMPWVPIAPTCDERGMAMVWHGMGHGSMDNYNSYTVLVAADELWASRALRTERASPVVLHSTLQVALPYIVYLCLHPVSLTTACIFNAGGRVVVVVAAASGTEKGIEVPAQSHPSPQPSKLAKAVDVTVAAAMDVAFRGQAMGKFSKRTSQDTRR
ncbi:hypothetical protein CMUS01_03569 [Colletotrichum musicola]|uniref:Uncharacterized protein n=1 Tax=Colletotrichum musicola TaxID=2175873 RepID=A0A8H6NRM6_9PEZI|nr:hypothetical protein CMUS01_03569 [Colletotrichum musicola]